MSALLSSRSTYVTQFQPRLALQRPVPVVSSRVVRSQKHLTKAKKFRIFASAHQSQHVCCTSTQEVVPDNSVCMILLAGGVGKRMGAKIPKQYLELNGRPIATYSLETFAKMREVGEIVIVCEESWRYVFEEAMTSLRIDIPFKWASPGAERQDSVFNGLQEVSAGCEMVGVHDSARPLVQPDDLSRCMVDGWNVGAAVLAVRVKETVKEVAENMDVIQTLDRSKLWAVQTPQMIKTQLLKNGYELVKKEGLEVTDDVSIIEASGNRVVITQGSYTNIKITTPEDLSTALTFLDEGAKASNSVTAAA
ncbi:hypothetical protein BSKO_08968 [Bryopsis sp. KO-2023]|nr:hypothetical protein BSKO_08968 [Bryopsis sp. KO-2023]